MSKLKEYQVSYKSLEYGEHTYSFKITDWFFEEDINTDIKGATLDVEVLLNKKNTHIELSFDIKGTVALNCDRCLELFDNKIDISQTIYIKFGEENSGEDENLYIFPESKNELDLSEFIIEFVEVALPMRRVHEDDEDGEPTCPDNMLDYIKNIKNEGSVIDPRWNELNKLKDGTS